MAVVSKKIPAPDLVPVRRALLSVSDKTGLIDLASSARQSRRRAGLDRRHGQGASPPSGIAVRDVSELTGFPEIMDGRVKTLHPVGAWRPARRPRRSRARGGHGGARHRADRPRRGQSLSLRGGRAIGRRLRLDRREHRHRRPGHDPRRGQEPRLCRHRHRSGRLRPVLDAITAQQRQPAARACARSSPPRPSPAPPPMTRPSPAGSPKRSRSRRPTGAPSAAGCRAHALRREPAPDGRLLPDRRQAPRRRHRDASCRARSSPTTTSTTPTPPSSWSPSSTRPARPPSPSSSTPIPAASPTAPTLKAAYEKALACDPVSAFGGIVALNRTLDARGRRGDRQDLHRGHHRARTPRPKRQAIVAAKKNLRLLVTGGLPDPRRAPALTVKSVAGGLLVQSRDNARGRRPRPQGRDQARSRRQRELADLMFAFTRRQARQVERHRLCQGRRRPSASAPAR